MKNMENVWTKCDKSMTSLMALMCGHLLMAFMNGELRMDDIHGRLHMVDYMWCLCRHVNDVRKSCKCMYGCYMSDIYMILYKW